MTSSINPSNRHINTVSKFSMLFPYSPYCSLYISYGTEKENFLEIRCYGVLELVITSFIPVLTFLFSI